MEKVKPYVIPKQIFMEAWGTVKANKASPGIDAESIEDLEKDLKDKRFEDWNRISTGRYFPPSLGDLKITK